MSNTLEKLLSPELIKKYNVDLYSPVLWDGERDLDWLMQKKKSAGSVSFYKSYQNEIVSGEDAIFQKEDLEKATDRGKLIKLVDKYEPHSWKFGQNIRTQGVDLAISEKETADYTVDITIAGLSNGDRVLLNIERGHLSPAETRRLIVNQYKAFDPVQVKVESVAYQASLVKDMKDFTNVPIKAYNTGGEKFDQFIGINSLATEFENGKWIIPYDKSDDRTMRLVNILLDEMLKFGPNGGHTGDCLMALWFANTALREMENKSSFGTMKSVGMTRKVI